MDTLPVNDVAMGDESQAEVLTNPIDGSNGEIPLPNGPLANKLHLRGVDDLSTNEIKSYLDQHVKPGYSFAKRDQFLHLVYRLEWINDSELNVVFTNEDQKLAHWGATEALKRLEKKEDGVLDSGDPSPLQERRCWDLLRVVEGQGKGKAVKVSADAARALATINTSDETHVDQDVDGVEGTNLTPLADAAPVTETNVVVSDPVALFVRYATSEDRKVANSKEQSRYYLLHGEPKHSERRQPRAKPQRQPRRSRFYEDREPDVVTGQLPPAPPQDIYRERDQLPRGPRRGRKNNRLPREEARVDEGDLFPDLLARKKAREQAAASSQQQAQLDRARDLSPSRMGREERV